MAYSAIHTLLRDMTGIDIVSIGEEAVNRIVKCRMKIGGQESVPEYFSYLQSSASERQALINEITVPETWFFRDSEPFKLLSEYACQAWSPGSGQKLRILSVPCSTGEEPYSIAMALLDAGFAPGTFTIDAADISTRVLELARRGLYGRNSFRNGDLSFRDRYFTESAGLYEVVEEVKRTVTFHHHNVLATDFMQGRGPYNIIFCRNLLIYFDLETKERVIRLLHRQLYSDGLLFLGHAETGRMVHGLFDSMRHPGAFAYQPAGSGKSESPRRVAATVVNPVVLQAEPLAPSSVVANRPAQMAVVEDGQKAPPSIGEIQALADKGDLDTAMKLCGAYIQRNPLEADGYYLQGIMFLAEDEDGKALSSFKRAVYLEPDHYRSLVQLSVLAEEQGDLQAAANYRARMERSKVKS